MRQILYVLVIACFLSAVPAWAKAPGSPKEGPGTATSQSLVGAWKVSVIRASGQGVVLLTFLSDGVFFRSGDTHPVLSVGHGVWKKVGDKVFDATYTALRFDDGKKFIGYQKTRIRITTDQAGNAFKAIAKVSTQDLEGKELNASESELAGTRIEVEPF